MTVRGQRRVVYFCFFISGAAGLIYEVDWARRLALFLGITGEANTAVITAFLAGLAAGAVAIGRLADRRHDCLRLYAWMEVGIAAYGVLTPWIFSSLERLYAGMAGSLGLAGTASHVLRFTLALAALLVPTFLMGGTLPLLVRGLQETVPEIADLVGRLYGLNTLGAAVGTFAAGYLLLPAWGIRSTLFFAAALNLGVAALILSLGRPDGAPGRKKGRKKKGRPPRQGDAGMPRDAGTEILTAPVARIVLLGFAVSGGAALVYQIAWIRALTLVIGSSVYAFSATLATFLAGLALGSLLLTRFRAGLGLGHAAVLEASIGFGALLTLPLIGRLPDFFVWGFERGIGGSFLYSQLFVFCLSFLIMLLPTLLLGALFPLLTALSARGEDAFGRAVGTAYAANTGGTIVGALLGGLLLLPALGIHRSVVLASALHVAVGAVYWGLQRHGTPVRRLAGAAAAVPLFVLLTWAIPPWDRALMSSGVFHRPGRFFDLPPGQGVREALSDQELVYYDEGIDGTVAVVASGSHRILVINGKTDASNLLDLPHQVMLGHLPILAHPEPRQVLVIGVGSGITTHAVVTHPEVEHVTLLEISPEVVAASEFFAEENGRVLEDRRVDLVLGDARNTLLAERRSYDVIVSQPSNPWISGVSNLFTREFFELADSRLAPGGVMAQWFQLYSMSTTDMKSVIRTFQSVFRHVTMWIVQEGDLILLGSRDPHSLDFARLEAAYATPAVREDLERAAAASPRLLVQKFLLGGDELARFTAGAALNTDDRPRIEFNAPRALYAETSLENLRAIVRHRSGRLLEAPVSGLATPTARGLFSPAMHLEVRTAGAPAEDDWEAAWLEVMTLGADGQFGVGSQRLLTWREGDVETEVQAAFIDRPPAPEELPAYLSSQLQGRADETGPAELAGARSGIWGTRADGPGGLAVAIVWTCAFDDGELTRYIAHRRQPDPGGPSASAALDLAGRLRCR